MRPIGLHAACGGEVLVERQAGEDVPTWTCQRCERRLIDPMELVPRGTGFIPDRQTRDIARFRLEA